MNQNLFNSQYTSELESLPGILGNSVLAKDTSVPCFWIGDSLITPDDPLYLIVLESYVAKGSKGPLWKQNQIPVQAPLPDPSKVHTEVRETPKGRVVIVEESGIGLTIIPTNQAGLVVDPDGEEDVNDAWPRKKKR